MFNKLLLTLLYSSLGTSLLAQDVLFSDNFENGTTNWLVNTASTGSNNWIVNNNYTGFLSLGINNTPAQPSTIQSPNGNYAHIHNSFLYNFIELGNAVFDTSSPSNANLDLSTSIDASQHTNLTLSYWYLCAGAANVSYGTVYYSTNGGSTWETLTTHQGVSTWTQATFTLPATANVANLKLRFNWINGAAGVDPAFAIDDVKLEGTATSQPVVGALSDLAVSETSAICQGNTIAATVTFDAVGNFTNSNIFSVQLSDNQGSFSNPQIIGSVTSNTNGLVSIPVSFANTLAAGTGYRIRVISTDEFLESNDISAGIIIHALPDVTLSSIVSICDTDPSLVLQTGVPAGGNYSGAGITSGVFNPADVQPGNHNYEYSYTDNNGCSGFASSSITVEACLNTISTSSAIKIYPNPVMNSFQISNYSGPVTIFDLVGKVVYQQSINVSSIDIENLPKGIYLVELVKEGKKMSYRIQKK